MSEQSKFVAFFDTTATPTNRRPNLPQADSCRDQPSPRRIISYGQARRPSSDGYLAAAGLKL